MPWTCKYCEALNDDNLYECFYCGAPRKVNERRLIVTADQQGGIDEFLRTAATKTFNIDVILRKVAED